MDNRGVEEQVSIIVDDEEIVQPDYSEAESSNSSSGSERFKFFTDHGMIRVEDGINEYEDIKKRFLVSIGSIGNGNHANVMAIHKNVHSNISGQAKLETFSIYSEAVGKSRGGNANIRLGWYGASRDEICKIIAHGFTCNQPEVDGLSYGVGIRISPVNLSVTSLLSTVADENGMRHMLLCGVILGNMEVVQPGSQQFQPTSINFDSGVDNLLTPRRHIIWNAYMNSYILPKYIISFKFLSFRGNDGIQNSPRSPFLHISPLLSILSNYLPPSKVALISVYHKDCLARRITREVLVRHIRQIAGDKLLLSVMRLYTNNKN